MRWASGYIGTQPTGNGRQIMQRIYMTLLTGMPFGKIRLGREEWPGHENERLQRKHVEFTEKTKHRFDCCTFGRVRRLALVKKGEVCIPIHPRSERWVSVNLFDLKLGGTANARSESQSARSSMESSDSLTGRFTPLFSQELRAGGKRISNQRGKQTASLTKATPNSTITHRIEDTKEVEGMLCLDRRAVFCVHFSF